MFSERIIELQKRHNLTRTDFAKSIGVSEGAVRSWELKGSKPRMGTLEKIADKYNVSRSWLSGYGEDVHADEEVKLNFYGSVSAGNFEELQPDILTLSVPQSIFKSVDPDECFIVKVNGDSMNKVLSNDSFVVIHDYRNTTYKPKTSDILLIRNGGGHTLKRVRITDTKIHFEPDSYIDEFKTDTYDLDYCDDIEIIGRVIYNYRNFI